MLFAAPDSVCHIISCDTPVDRVSERTLAPAWRRLISMGSSSGAMDRERPQPGRRWIRRRRGPLDGDREGPGNARAGFVDLTERLVAHPEVRGRNAKTNTTCDALRCGDALGRWQCRPVWSDVRRTCTQISRTATAHQVRRERWRSISRPPSHPRSRGDADVRVSWLLTASKAIL